MKIKIPIFIIVHNHLEILKRSLASYEKFIDHPKQFVFHNTNSQYQPCLDFLKEREAQGDLVYHTNTNHHLSVRATISDYLSKNKDSEYFILTDPDVELQESPGNIVETYIYLINKYKTFCVGCWHRTDDIPDYYPLKSEVHKGYTKRYYNDNQKIKETFDGTDFSISIAPIDTTFQLIRAKSFNPLENFPHNNCIRVFDPYNARHLDWYIDPNNLTDCQKYYRDTATHVSHWNNPNWKGY